MLCHFGNIALEHEELWESSTIPLAVHFHGYDATVDLREPNGSGRPVHPENYAEHLVKLSKRSTFIANSEFTKKNLLSFGVSSDRIVVKRLGVTVSGTPKIHQSKDWPIIVTVGRLVDFKGFDLTVQAFAKLRKRGVRAKLDIIGDGPMRSNVEAAIDESGFKEDITLPGWVPNHEMRQRLVQADIYTVHNQLGPVSHQEEALNVSVMEAMGVGLPIVGTDSGGVSESVVPGITGFIGRARNIEDQADSLQKLVEDASLRERMGSAGRERVLMQMTVAQETEQLRALLLRQS